MGQLLPRFKKIVTPPTIRKTKKTPLLPPQKSPENKKGIHIIIISWYNICTTMKEGYRNGIED